MIHAKVVAEFPKYLITSCGRVYSKHRFGRFRRLRPEVTRLGYLRVCLYGEQSRKRVLVHRLVADAFMSMPPSADRVEINHIDGNKANNRVENLEWTTRSGNLKHSYNCLGVEHLSGAEHPCAKPVLQLDMDGNCIASFDTAREAARATKTSFRGISKCCRNERRTAGGFMWAFKS